MRVKNWLLVTAVGTHRDLTVINHDVLRYPAEILESVSMTSKEVLEVLAKDKLGKHHSAITKDHDKNTESSSGVADGDFPAVSEVNLSVFAGFEPQS
jgi:hypothetical protein